MKTKITIPDSFYKEEIRCNFKVTSTMKSIWAIELDLLSEIDRICKKYKITYFAIGGTMLGGIRHEGYIPWDDDLDIAMFREDYNKFCEVAPLEMSHPYFFQTEDTDPGYLLRHAKVRNSETTGILYSQKGKKFKFNQGIFVDIFPVDNIPDDENERILFFSSLYDAWGETYKLSSSVNRESNNFSIEEKKRLAEKIRISNNNYENLSARYSDVVTKEKAILPIAISASKAINQRFIWQADWLDGIKYYPFEFTQVPIPIKYGKLLEKQYGDWTKFVKGSSLHGEVLFDPEKPYTDYIC